MKQSLCIYFKVHHPFQLKEYGPKDVGVNHFYEDIMANATIIRNLADECYLPANEILLSNIHQGKGNCKVSFSISGIMIELLQQYRPDVIESFIELAETGCVEILAETYHHSLSSLYSKKEFQKQIQLHAQIVENIFGLETKIFRNTELIHNNQLAAFVGGMGFNGILCEGIDRILQGRSPNRLYAAPGAGDLALLLRNTRLSDDIAFRFDDPAWSEYPLTAQKFAEWLTVHPTDDEVVNIFFDYETFGIHKKANSGIFDFLKELPASVSTTNFRFSTPSHAIQEHYPRDMYDAKEITSWGDPENARQNNALKKIYSLENLIGFSTNDDLIRKWRLLQTVDYFYQVNESNANIITDLELSLIKEQMKINKLDFIPLTHNVY